MNNHISITNSNIQFLKIIFKIFCFCGAFPLEMNSVARIICLVFVLILHFIGICCTLFEIVSKLMTVKPFNAPVYYVIIISQEVSIFLNLLCFLGIIKNRKSWNHFFALMDKLTTAFPPNLYLKSDVFKLIICLFPCICSHIWQVWKYGLTNTFSYAIAYIFWILHIFKIIGIALVIWKTSDILTIMYLNLRDVIKAEKLINRGYSRENRFKMQRDLVMLNQAVIQINNIMEKMFFIVFTSTYLHILSLFYYVLSLIDSKYAFDSLLFVIIMFVCLELVVSNNMFL